MLPSFNIHCILQGYNSMGKQENTIVCLICDSLKLFTILERHITNSNVTHGSLVSLRYDHTNRICSCHIHGDSNCKWEHLTISLHLMVSLCLKFTYWIPNCYIIKYFPSFDLYFKLKALYWLVVIVCTGKL